MDFGSGFPSGSQARIRASLGIDGLLNGKFDKSGGVLSGSVTSTQYFIASTYPVVQWQNTIAPTDLKRTQVFLDSSGNLGFVRIIDDNSTKDYPLIMNASGKFGLSQRPSFGINTPWDTGSFDPNGKLDRAAGGDVTGNVSFRAQTYVIHQTAFRINDGGGNAGVLEVRGTGSADSAAFMQFHRPGVFAAYLGIDTDNQWKVGGWSMGAVAYKLWHEGNLTLLKKFVGTITGDGTKNSFDVIHNLNTSDFTFNVKDASGYSSLVDVIPKDANTATVIMGTALDASATRKVVIIG